MTTLRRSGLLLVGVVLATTTVASSPGVLTSARRFPASSPQPVAPESVLTTLVGSPGGGRGTAVAQEPIGLAVAPGGALDVVDDRSNTVRQLSASGGESVVLGTGFSGYNGDDRSASSADLSEPASVAVDFGGDLIVADTANDRVRMVASSTCVSDCAYGLPYTIAGDVYTIAGNGESGDSGDGGLASAAELDGPEGVAVGADGDVLVADSRNDAVRLVALASCTSGCPYGLGPLTRGDIYALAGTGSYGSGGDGSPARQAQLALPAGIATDRRGDLVVADAGNNAVRIVAASSCTSGCPFGLASMTAGDIYALAGDGTAGSSGSGVAATAAALDAPSDVAVDGAGDVIVADTLDDVVQLVAASGCASGCPFGLAGMTAGDLYTIAGTGTDGWGGDGGPALSASFSAPAGVAVDGAGDLVVADTGNDRVRLVAASSCTTGCPFGLGAIGADHVATVAGTGGTGYSGDGGPATAAELDAPSAVAADGRGDVFVADPGTGRVRMRAAWSCPSSCPYGLAPFGAGDVVTVAGDGTDGESGDGGPARAAGLAGPGGLAVGPGGDLLVADTSGDDVRLVAAATCRSSCPFGLSVVAGDIYGLAGDAVAGLAGDGGPASSARLDEPGALAVDPSGDVLIADTANARVRLVAAGNCTSGCPYGLAATVAGDIYTVAGTAPGFAGDGGPARAAALDGPGGLAIGPSGDLVVSDTLNSRVRLVGDVSCAQDCPYGLASVAVGSIYTVAGSGAFGDAGDGGPARAAALALPAGLAVDAAGDLFVADSANDRVRVVANVACDADCPFGAPAASTGSILTVLGTGVLSTAPNIEPALGAPVADPTALVGVDGGVGILEAGTAEVRLLAPEPGDGFDVVTDAGNVYNFGAPWYGSAAGLHLSAPVVGAAADEAGGGYWLVGSDGGIFSYGGAARFYGSMGGKRLNKPVVGMAATPDGRGYWLVASDGGIFAFGDATFYGSTGGLRLNKPVVGMAATPDGRGYWLVASDGGIFAFGDATFYGSTGSLHLKAPVVGMAATADGRGYWLVGSDGGIFAFGDAGYHGSLGMSHQPSPVVSMAADPLNGAYRLVEADGAFFAFACSSYGDSRLTTVSNRVVAIVGAA